LVRHNVVRAISLEALRRVLAEAGLPLRGGTVGYPSSQSPAVGG